MGCQKLIYKPELGLYSSENIKGRNGIYIYKYRYGFNGKEVDNDIYGEGNAYDFGARIYDGRLGRWMSLDPLKAKYPHLSPYDYVADNPIIFIDPSGELIVFADDGGQSEAAYLKLFQAADIQTKMRLNALAQSEIVVQINAMNKDLSSSGETVIAGVTKYNFQKNQIEININGNMNEGIRIGALGDELRTASLFAEGQYGYIEGDNGVATSFFYERGDEAETIRASIKAKASLGENLSESEENFTRLDAIGGTNSYFEEDPVGKTYSHLSSNNVDLNTTPSTDTDLMEACQTYNANQIFFYSNDQSVKATKTDVTRKKSAAAQPISHNLSSSGGSSNFIGPPAPDK